MLKSVILLYTAVNPPVLLALSPQEDIRYLNHLIKEVIHLLPVKFYSHLTPGTEDSFTANYNFITHGKFQKMFLTDKTKIIDSDSADIVHLKPGDIDDINTLYSESYPENSFDPRMLETGMYFGMRFNGKLVNISGVHVYSEQQKVAALGNITTHREYRGKGIGQKVTAHLCSVLLKKVDAIGLNVSRSNMPAIKCYSNLGFTVIAPYMEYMIERK
jgi:GNAT superfamily N-acetyltransferase